MIRRFSFLVLLWAAAPLAWALDNEAMKLAHAYRSERLADWIDCEVVLNSTESGAGIFTPVNHDKYNACIRAAKATASKNFERALTAIKKPEARAAFLRYHTAALAVFDGMRQGPNEGEADYKRRTDSLNREMDKQWAGFEKANK